MNFLFFGGKIVFFFFFAKIQSPLWNIFIIFVKFLDCIVAIWVRLVKLIEEKEALTIKMKYRMIIKKIKNLDLGGPGSPLGSVPMYKLSTQWAVNELSSRLAREKVCSCLCINKPSLSLSFWLL